MVGPSVSVEVDDTATSAADVGAERSDADPKKDVGNSLSVPAPGGVFPLPNSQQLATSGSATGIRRGCSPPAFLDGYSPRTFSAWFNAACRLPKSIPYLTISLNTYFTKHIIFYEHAVVLWYYTTS